MVCIGKDATIVVVLPELDCTVYDNIKCHKMHFLTPDFGFVANCAALLAIVMVMMLRC